MFRRFSGILFALLLCFFSACAKEPTGAPSVPTRSEAPDTPISGEPSPETTEPPRETAGAEAAPFTWNGTFDGEVYVSLANQNCYFFENDGLVPGIAFKIISREEIKKERIKVRVPLQTAYTVDVSDATEEYRTATKDGVFGAFGFDAFLMMQNPDWSILSKIKENENNLMQWQASHHAGEASWDITDPEEIALNQKVEEGYSYLLPYLEAWESFTDSDIPRFYVYYVSITFQPPYEDVTVDHIDLTMGDKTITVPFGEWQFYNTAPDTFPARDGYGLRQEMLGALAIGGTFLDSGYGVIADAFSFTVGRDDLTVTGAAVCGTDCETLGAHVRILNGDREAVSDYYWDLRSPMDFKAGQTVSVDVIVYQERLKQFEFNGTAYLTMHYEINDRPHTMSVPCFLRRSNEVLETYFAVFEKLDLKEAYPYLYGDDSYVPDFPEAWRKDR